MNINFKTHFPWPGADGQPEPTRFTEQILHGLLNPGDLTRTAKLHTIRRVNNDRPRYREGMKLVLQGGTRFKPMPFAETVCTGVQTLHMETRFTMDQSGYRQTELLVGSSSFFDYTQLAVNDGLSVENFTRWFLLDVLANGPGMFQLVHWTDLRY